MVGSQQVELDIRKIALVKKDLLYIGKPCKKGHIGERYTSTGQCVICTKQYRIQYRKENKQKVAENRNRYSKEKIFGTEKYKSYRREHYKKNRQIILARNKTPSYRLELGRPPLR